MKKTIIMALVLALATPAFSEEVPAAPKTTPPINSEVQQELNKPIKQEMSLEKKQLWGIVILVVLTTAVTVAAYAAGRTGNNNYSGQ